MNLLRACKGSFFAGLFHEEIEIKKKDSKIEEEISYTNATYSSIFLLFNGIIYYIVGVYYNSISKGGFVCL